MKLIGNTKTFKPKYEGPWASFSYTVDLFDTLENLGFCRSYIHDVSGHSGPSLIVEGMSCFTEKAWIWNKVRRRREKETARLRIHSVETS